jgi:soluble lytic murein transglycosylase-like protein
VKKSSAQGRVLAAFTGRVLLIGALGFNCAAQAGNQKEEQLADSVRLALTRAIHDGRPPKPVFRDEAARLKYDAWFAEMSRRLQKRLPEELTRREFLESAWYEATRAGLDPGLVLGLIQVESGYRKYAISLAGARGYMQVMPFWTRIIGDSNRRALFDMQTNLRYGCSILRMYLDMEGGDYFLALGRYNGSRGRPEYPNAVLAAWKKWQFNASQPVAAALSASNDKR